MSDSSGSDLEILMELSDWDSDTEVETQRTYKCRINHMSQLYEFTYRFCLNKTVVSTHKIYSHLKVTSKRNHGIPPLHQLLLALRFYTLGTTIMSIAEFVGVSKSSARRIVSDISSAITRLYSKYIYVHRTRFHSINQFPRVLGKIDGTHILIQSRNSNIGKKFRNRKGYFSINVQGVRDAQLRFMNLSAP